MGGWSEFAGRQLSEAEQQKWQRDIGLSRGACLECAKSRTCEGAKNHRIACPGREQLKNHCRDCGTEIGLYLFHCDKCSRTRQKKRLAELDAWMKDRKERAAKKRAACAKCEFGEQP